MKKSIELGGAAIILVVIVVFGILYLNPHLKSAARKTQVAQPVQTKNTAPTVQAAGKSYAEVAVATTTVMIKGCKPSPQVVKVTNTTPVTFVNTDSVNRTISFAPTIQYKIAAKSSTKVDFSSWTRPGIRKYSCDDQVNVGQIYIIN